MYYLNSIQSGNWCEPLINCKVGEPRKHLCVLCSCFLFFIVHRALNVCWFGRFLNRILVMCIYVIHCDNGGRYHSIALLFDPWQFLGVVTSVIGHWAARTLPRVSEIY